VQKVEKVESNEQVAGRKRKSRWYHGVQKKATDDVQAYLCTVKNHGHTTAFVNCCQRLCEYHASGALDLHKYPQIAMLASLTHEYVLPAQGRI
jgi:hypothetical protein